MKRTTTAAAILAAATVTLAACGGGESSTSATVNSGRTPAEAGRCTEDKAGGTITMGEYSMLPTFAPGQSNFGVRGAAESAAIYDRLMRWNPEAEEFEPKLAQSLESSEDNTVWTLKLREGVTFSNGDPLAASDVAFTVNLHKNPATKSTALTDLQQVKETRVVDPQTVEFTLTEPWSGFPILLSGTAGEVLPEKAFAEADADEWAENPVGAGAFVLDKNIPNQEVVLKPNPSYYGGPVCPTLRFISIPGGQATLDSFQIDEIQVGFLRGAKFVTAAQDADEQGFYEVLSSGSALNMNSGASGYDGVFTDVRVRQAVGFALDRKLIDQRITGGLGQPTSAILAEASRFFDGEQGPDFDVEKAKKLVDEVKAEKKDWNGEITLLTTNSPENVETGVVVKALLDAAGFDVTLENAPVSQVTARQFTGDYEIVIGGLSPSDADPAATFSSAMRPGGATNLTGIDDPELIDAITRVKEAATLDEQKSAYIDLQEIHNKLLPFTVFANAEQYVVVDESVRGVTPTLASTMLFDGAYLEK